MEISRSLDHQEPRRTDYGVRDAWLPDPGATTYVLAMLSPAQRHLTKAESEGWKLVHTQLSQEVCGLHRAPADPKKGSF